MNKIKKKGSQSSLCLWLPCLGHFPDGGHCCLLLVLTLEQPFALQANRINTSLSCAWKEAKSALRRALLFSNGGVGKAFGLLWTKTSFALLVLPSGLHPPPHSANLSGYPSSRCSPGMRDAFNALLVLLRGGCRRHSDFFCMVFAPPCASSIVLRLV